MREITTAEKKLRNGEIKESDNASYGHAAKVLDISAKVFVYYCGLPSAACAGKLCAFLHSAVDRPMLKEFKKLFPGQVRVTSVEEISDSRIGD